MVCSQNSILSVSHLASASICWISNYIKVQSSINPNILIEPHITAHHKVMYDKRFLFNIIKVRQRIAVKHK